MLSHFARRVTIIAKPSSSVILCRHLSTPAAAAAPGLMKLNFNLPQETLYDSTYVSSVIVPGATGEYEVTADHVPIVAELKAGVLTIKHSDGGGDEKYFVPGGFSLTHEGSTTVRGVERHVDRSFHMRRFVNYIMFTYHRIGLIHLYIYMSILLYRHLNHHYCKI
jgi:hypothetical protein